MAVTHHTVPSWLVLNSPDWKRQIEHLQQQGMTQREAVQELANRRAIFDGRATLEDFEEAKGGRARC